MPDPADRRPFDCAVVGGGLQGTLVALAWLVRRPAARVALVERACGIASERTWCFHDDDLPAEARAFVEPLIEQRWAGYEVRFPGLRRVPRLVRGCGRRDRAGGGVGAPAPGLGRPPPSQRNIVVLLPGVL